MEDVIQLRATCCTIQKEAAQFLYRSSVEKLMKEEHIRHWREFNNRERNFIGLVQDGNFLGKAQAIDSCLKNLKKVSPEEKARATEELSQTGSTANFCTFEDCYGCCCECQGRYGRPKKYWERKLTAQTNLTKHGVMSKWMEFYRQLQDWQESYLFTAEHVPEEKRETLDRVHTVHRILFGLYLGCQECDMTTIQRREGSNHYSYSSKEFYVRFVGSEGEIFLLEWKTSDYHEICCYGCSDDEEDYFFRWLFHKDGW